MEPDSMVYGFHSMDSMKPVLDMAKLVQIYQSLIIGTISYGSSLFVGSSRHKDVLAINRLEKRAHHAICGFNCRKNCLPVFRTQQKKQSLRLFKKALDNPDHILHSR